MNSGEDLPQPLAAATGQGRATLATELVVRMREAILSGELKPGARLRLDELRKAYGVSLSPLREALSRLGSEGLVLLEDQRGIRVAPVSLANLQEIIALRLTLEVQALRGSVELGDMQWEARVVAALHLLQRHERAPQGPPRVQEWEQLHRQLHFALISACDKPLLLQFCTMLHDRNDRYRRLFLVRQTVDASVMHEHAAIVQACLDRQPTLAGERLAAHIERTAHYVYEAIARRTPR